MEGSNGRGHQPIDHPRLRAARTPRVWDRPRVDVDRSPSKLSITSTRGVLRDLRHDQNPTSVCFRPEVGESPKAPGHEGAENVQMAIRPVATVRGRSVDPSDQPFERPCGPRVTLRPSCALTPATAAEAERNSQSNCTDYQEAKNERAVSLELLRLYPECRC
jgi:hypothetical protein